MAPGATLASISTPTHLHSTFFPSSLPKTRSLHPAPETACHGSALSPLTHSTHHPLTRSTAGISRWPANSRSMAEPRSTVTAGTPKSTVTAQAATDIKPLALAASSAGSGVPGLNPGGLRVAYQGVPGAYSEMAAKKAYPDCNPVPCSQFDDAFLAVEQWLVDRAVLPIENSLGGSIHRNYDLLLRHRLHIVGEVQLPVNHCLLALPGTQISDITRVMSHPQALAQTEMTLSKLGSMTREAVDDTAGAAKMVAQQRLAGVGAVASKRAAEIYSLEVLAEGIQDDSDNITRFLVLAREPILPSNNLPFKTSIVFTLEKGPGVLFKALSVFALRDINLTKIESRPQRDKPLVHQSAQDTIFSSQSQNQQNLSQGLNETGIDPGTALFTDGVLRNSTSNGNPTSSGNGTNGSSSAMAPSEVVPCPAQMFDYLFYIDFQASLAERNAQNALRHLQEFAPFLRVLGSYPMDIGLPVE